MSKISDQEHLDEAKKLGIPSSAIPFFDDIGAGICGAQTLFDGDSLKTVKNGYQPQTGIPALIDEILTPFLEQLHRDLSWQGDTVFTNSHGTKITIVDWPIDGSGATIQFDDDPPRKFSKKYILELYKNNK